MMPIFFNLGSHAWIAYLLFANGLLLALLLRARFATFQSLTKPLEALVLSAFFFSIAINGGLLLGFQMLDLKLSSALAILGGLTFVLVLSNAWLGSSRWRELIAVEFAWSRALLYTFVFLILFLNGGLIEQISDAWWHMSLANKIASENSYALSTGHLTGLTTRSYPPLWHGNLAILKVVSGESLPVLWNSFTAWGAVLKVMAFYLFALALTGRAGVAVVSALLFVLIPGVGNSYLRVSAWPSHIAYTAWFCLFYLAFRFFDDRQPRHLAPRLRDWMRPQSAVYLLGGVFLAMVIYFSHKAELLYFAMAFLFYWLGLQIYRLSRVDGSLPIEAGQGWLNLGCAVLICVVMYFSGTLLIDEFSSASLDQKISLLLVPIFLMILLLGVAMQNRLPKGAGILLVLVLVGALLATIDLRHTLSLFNPELAYSMTGARQNALIAQGFFGGDLRVPGWHLQLREGLLYSGILSIPISVGMAVVSPSRETVFLASAAFLSLLFCFSPYLYEWLIQVLEYHSPWRVAILLLHPIIYAVLLAKLWSSLRGER